MPIRNESQVTYLDQSEIDSGDIVVWEKPPAGYWVVSGGIVTAQGTADGTVAVSAGTGRVGGSNKTITAGNVSVLTGSANPDGTTATASDATLARIDLIVLNGSSQLGVLHGTPAGLSPNNDGSYLCEWPLATNYLILAAVMIPPNAAVVTSSMIETKRIVGSVDAFHDQIHAASGANHSGDFATTQMPQLSAWSSYANDTASTADPTTAHINYINKDWAFPGTVSVRTGAGRWYNRTGRTLTFDSITAAVGTAPTGATLIVDVNVDGTTIMTGTKVVVAISGNVIEQTTFSTTTIADNSYITVDIDQIGSTVAGADLVVTCWLKG